MACEALRKAMQGRPQLVVIYGTAYHTGAHEDWENDIAAELHATKIGAHEWVQVEGVVFDFKHHVNGSQTPYGRHTALNREAVWQLMWASKEYVPHANVLVRSHVHYYTAAMDDWEPRLRVSTPALQAMGTRYGARRCSGLVSFGFLIFEVRRTDARMTPVLADLVTTRTHALQI